MVETVPESPPTWLWTPPSCCWIVPRFCCWDERAFEREVFVWAMVDWRAAVVDERLPAREETLVDSASILDDSEFMRAYEYIPAAMITTAMMPNPMKVDL